MKFAACDSSWLKSSCRIARWVDVMPSFDSSVSFCRTVCSRSEMLVAPAIATLAMPLALFSPCTTAPSALTSPRMPWAIAKFEASSIAPVTFKPVDTRFWVTASVLLVRSRFRSAIRASGLVRMELFAIVPVLRQRSIDPPAGAFLPACFSWAGADGGPRQTKRKPRAKPARHTTI
jgi:hypothetical protein